MTICGLVLVAAVSTAADDKKDVPKDLVPFQGNWKAVKVEAGGKALPPEALAELGLAFAGEKITIKKKDPATGTFSVDAKKDPAEIKIDAKEGKVFGIYKFDKDGRLTITYRKGRLDAKPEDRPKKFDDKEAVMMVLEKVKE
jgi:uncharacterized protein (TIGR03067 family)